ncbi:hypothetical protein ACTJIJ_22995 [Niabella sp. 22666]|uniref:hypothetical protein n=1 Tax=Niabella sp. 22666 TaxID=3453954 RepID=UPI003F86225C
MEIKEALQLLEMPADREASLKDSEKELLLQLANEKKMLQAVADRHRDIKKVYQLKVPLDDTYTKFTYGYLKYPDRSDISIAMTMDKTDPLKGKEIVLRNNWLEGDNQILEDDELFISATTALDDLLAIRKAIIKKN